MVAGRDPGRGGRRRSAGRGAGRGALAAAAAEPVCETTTVRTSPVILKSITELSRYEAASGSFEVVVDLNRSSLLPSFLEGSDMLFIGQGTDIAYIDFSQLKGQSIQVNATRTAVTVKLPKAQLEPAVMNVSQSYVYAQQQGLFNRIGNFFSGNPNSQQQVYVQAQQKIQAAAAASPLLTEAQKNAEACSTACSPHSASSRSVSPSASPPPASAAGMPERSIRDTQTEPGVQEVAMMRSHRRTLVVWSQSSGPPAREPRPRLTWRRRARRRLRIGVLLTIIGLTPVARAVLGRWRILLPATVLTVAGVMLRSGQASIVLVPGLVLFFWAPLVPARFKADRTRPSELERELTGYCTTAHRHDLEAMLDRYPDDVTLELRDILARQHLAVPDHRFPATGQ